MSAVFYVLIGLYVVVSLILIAVVLLQSGKGADLAGAFGGGGSQTAFGARGTATFLSKLTTVAAILFMLLALALSIMYNRQRSGSLMSTVPTEQQQQPAQQPPAPAQPDKTPPK